MSRERRYLPDWFGGGDSDDEPADEGGIDEELRGPVSTTRGEVMVAKSYRDDYRHPTVGFRLSSEHDRPVRVRIEEALPIDFALNDIGCREEDIESWSIHEGGAYLRFECVIPPDGIVDTMYGVRRTEQDFPEELLREPHIVHVDPISQEGSDGGGTSRTHQRVESNPEHPLVEGPPEIAFTDVAGFTEVKARLREDVLEPFENPQFEAYDIGRINGLLLYGPPGTGKTYLARAIAGELGYHFLPVSPATVISKAVGEGVEKLDAVFAAAREHQPVVVFLDELDAIAGERGANMTQSQEQMVNTLLTEVASINANDEDILVIGATNAPDQVDPALKRTGRFDTTMKIGLPDPDTRLAILEHALTARGPPVEKFYLSEPFQETFIEQTAGFRSSDVTEIAESAQRTALREAPTDSEPRVTADHVLNSVDEIDDKQEQDVASEYLIESPDVTFEDVGGMADIKTRLRERVIEALGSPGRYETYGLSPPNGILLHGPPGTGKTHLSRALAGEAGVTFLSITASDVTSKWIGEAASNVATLFDRAIEVQPTILFIDEIDAVAGERGGNQTTSESQMVNELLTGLTRIQEEDVVVIATTNRLDVIDSAVTRAGRMDETMEVPPPDGRARVEMLKVQLRHRPVAWADIDWSTLEELTGPEEHDAPLVAADIATLADEAARRAMHEAAGRDDVIPIAMRHLERALKEIDPSLAR